MISNERRNPFSPVALYKTTLEYTFLGEYAKTPYILCSLWETAFILKVFQQNGLTQLIMRRFTPQ
jgi:hypothetical protein